MLPGGGDPSGCAAAGAQSRFLGVWYPFLAAALATLAGAQLTLPAQFAARALGAPAGQLGPALAQLGGACALLPCAALHTLAVRCPALARPANHPGVRGGGPTHGSACSLQPHPPHLAARRTLQPCQCEPTPGRHPCAGATTRVMHMARSCVAAVWVTAQRLRCSTGRGED